MATVKRYHHIHFVGASCHSVNGGEVELSALPASRPAAFPLHDFHHVQRSTLFLRERHGQVTLEASPIGIPLCCPGRLSIWLKEAASPWCEITVTSFPLQFPMHFGNANRFPSAIFDHKQTAYLAVRLDFEYTPSVPGIEPFHGKAQEIQAPLFIPNLTTVNVVFIFPEETAVDPYLLANITELKKVSPYWKRMFEGRWQESEEILVNVSGWKDRLQKDIFEVLQQHRTIEDYDRGTIGSCATQVQSVTSLEDSVRYVVVKDASKNLYEALFEALQVGQLQSSTIEKVSDGSPGSTCESAKSLYALAHKLEIEQAQEVALEAFETCLSSDNALQELMSSDAFIYPFIKEAAMKAFLKHWATIAEDAQSFIAQVGEEGDVDLQQVLLTTLELYKRVGKAISA